MTEGTEKKTYSTREFADKFRFHTLDVQKACKSGELKATKNKIGRWRIPESEVKRFAALVEEEERQRRHG